MSDDGGCPVTGFAVFRNDGNDGTVYTEVNSAIDANVRDKPNLHQLAVTVFPASSVGKTFKFIIRAFTFEGEVDSDSSGFALG